MCVCLFVYRLQYNWTWYSVRSMKCNWAQSSSGFWTSHVPKLLNRNVRVWAFTISKAHSCEISHVSLASSLHYKQQEDFFFLKKMAKKWHTKKMFWLQQTYSYFYGNDIVAVNVFLYRLVQHFNRRDDCFVMNMYYLYWMHTNCRHLLHSLQYNIKLSTHAQTHHMHAHVYAYTQR